MIERSEKKEEENPALGKILPICRANEYSNRTRPFEISPEEVSNTTLIGHEVQEYRLLLLNNRKGVGCHLISDRKNLCVTKS